MTEPQANSLDPIRDTWTQAAATQIGRRLDDARLHAASGDVDTARMRVAELTTFLIGHVAAARRTLYHHAWHIHLAAGLDPSIHQLDQGPTLEGAQAAGTVEILGRSFPRDAWDLNADAIAGLDSAVLAGGGPFLESWHGDTAASLADRAAQEIGTAQHAIFEAVGQLLLKPAMRPELSFPPQESADV
jgi:hypothetical protein